MSEVKVNKISPRTACGTVTLGDSGDTIALGAGASQTGFGRTGTVDWDTTPKTTTFTAVSGDGFFCNTTSGAFTCNLPAGVAGAIVSLADYAGTWQTNNLTVSPNGSDKIGGVNSDVALNTEGQSVTFIFVDSTQGWINTMDSTSNERGNPFIAATGGTITTSGNFKIHTFTGPGTFTVTNGGAAPGSNTVSYMVVGGGGAGGGGADAGGGAGGFREGKASSDCYTASPLNAPAGLPVTAQAYPITVGGGGSAPGGSGANSIFSTITSHGGGGAGSTGGSGGGASWSIPGPAPGASGNSPPVSPPQGNPGGNGGGPPNFASGGGGGAGGSGGNASPGSANSGAGGNGIATSINTTPTLRAGGGGGSATCQNAVQGSGGPGGGGAGAPRPGVGVAGTANTGGGGGGGSNYAPSPKAAGSGGSGIVIIRYKFQ